MSMLRAKEDYVQFKLPWQVPKILFAELYESGKSFSRRFWTTHKNASLEWKLEFAKNNSDGERLDLKLEYASGRVATIDEFNFSVIGIYSDNRCTHLHDENIEHSLTRGETFVHEQCATISLADGAYYHESLLKLPVESFDFDDSSLGPDGHEWMSNLYEHIDNEVSSKYSDVRLISGDGHTFYCHRNILGSQSAPIDAMFRNAKTDEEKNGNFRLSAWSTEELRKILEYFYKSKPDLKSSTIEQLMNIYDFGEQHGLGHLKTCVEKQLWDCAVEKPIDCSDIARFADLHLQNGLKPLKYRCYDVLADNFSQMELEVEEMFEETTTSRVDGEPPTKKMSNSSDGDNTTKEKSEDTSVRLRKEFIEYLCERIVGVMILESDEAS